MKFSTSVVAVAFACFFNVTGAYEPAQRRLECIPPGGEEEEEVAPPTRPVRTSGPVGGRPVRTSARVNGFRKLVS